MKKGMANKSLPVLTRIGFRLVMVKTLVYYSFCDDKKGEKHIPA